MWSRLALTVCALVQLLGLLPHWSAVHPAVFKSDDELVCRARPLEHDDGPPLDRASDGFTGVAAFEVVGLASFSASVALIESSFAQQCSNLDLHTSECGPS